MVAFRRNQVTKRAATSKNLKPTKLWTSSTWQGSKTVAIESSPKDFPPFKSYGLWDFINFKKKSSRFLLISPLHKFHYFPEKKLKNDAKTINNILPSLYWCHYASVIHIYIFFPHHHQNLFSCCDFALITETPNPNYHKQLDMLFFAKLELENEANWTMTVATNVGENVWDMNLVSYGFWDKEVV